MASGKWFFWAAATVIPSGLVMAAEGPSFQVTTLRNSVIQRVDSTFSPEPGFKPHIRFPGMKRLGDGTFHVWYNIGQTHGSVSAGGYATSADGGQTWTLTNSLTVMPVTLMRPPGQTSLGFNPYHEDAAGFTSWSQTSYRSTTGGPPWTTPFTSFFNTGGVSYVSMYFTHHSEVVEDAGAWLMPLFGTRSGQSTTEMVLFSSINQGVTWSRRATIASFVDGPDIVMGDEGPNEGDILRLDNGQLLAVFRTGQPHPNCDDEAVHPSICTSLSIDSGMTWSPPRMLGVAGVFPMLRKLPGGWVAMTYGRRSGKLLFADPTGTRWSRPTIVYQGPTSGHVDLRQASDGKFVYIHDQSSFYNPGQNNTVPPCFVYSEGGQEVAYMRALRLDIQPQPLAEDYDWLFELHGEVRPDQLATNPWTRTAAGDVSDHLLADQGQDYLRLRSGRRWLVEYDGVSFPWGWPRRSWGARPVMWSVNRFGNVTDELRTEGNVDYLRMNTGPTGANQSLYYTLHQYNSSWPQADFAEGVVADLRARVVSAATQQGGANLFLSDGSHGYIVLELTGSGINLEGVGGNAGQASTSAVNVFDWHRYTLVIAPDAQAGGAIRAKLFLDGNFTAPLLAQAPQAAAADELWFGDGTGSNNGHWDVDYLRVGRLPETGHPASTPPAILNYTLRSDAPC
jgi:hypothetical protein